MSNLTADCTTTFGLHQVVSTVLATSFSTVALCLNTLLLYATLTNGDLKPINILTANLCVVSNFAVTMAATCIAGLDFSFQREWLCSVFSYFRNVIAYVITLTILGIHYTLVRKIKMEEGTLLINRMMRLIWGISVIFAIPTLILSLGHVHTHVDGTEHYACLNGTPDKYRAAGILYDVLRTTIFQLAVPVYMTFSIYRVRSLLHFIMDVGTLRGNNRRRVTITRFIYSNYVCFILLWIPFCLGVYIFRYYNNKELDYRFQQLDHEHNCEERERSTAFYVIVGMFYFYILILPLLICYNDESLKIIRIRDTDKSVDESDQECEIQEAEIPADEGVEVAIADEENLEMVEMARRPSTLDLPGCSRIEEFPLRKVKFEVNLSKEQEWSLLMDELVNSSRKETLL